MQNKTKKSIIFLN